MEAFFPGSSQARRRFAVEVTELVPDGTPAVPGAAAVRGWPVERPSGTPSLALRIDLGGVSFGYSGDPQWTTALAHAADGAEMIVAEACTYDTASVGAPERGGGALSRLGLRAECTRRFAKCLASGHGAGPDASGVRTVQKR